MSNNSDECRFGITWRIADSARLGQRLGKFGMSVPLGREVQYGQLFAWGHDQRPRLIGWLPLDERLHATVNREMKDKSHSLARWLERQPALDISTIAIGWTFYWRHLQDGGSDAWPTHLRRAFPRDPLLDGILALSKGWLLWDFQLQLLAQLCRLESHVLQNISIQLRDADSSFQAVLQSARLPDGRSLANLLKERGYPPDQTIAAFEADVVSRLYAILNATSPHPGKGPWP